MRRLLSPARLRLPRPARLSSPSLAFSPRQQGKTLLGAAHTQTAGPTQPKSHKANSIHAPREASGRRQLTPSAVGSAASEGAKPSHSAQPRWVCEPLLTQLLAFFSSVHSFWQSKDKKHADLQSVTQSSDFTELRTSAQSGDSAEEWEVCPISLLRRPCPRSLKTENQAELLTCFSPKCQSCRAS